MANHLSILVRIKNLKNISVKDKEKGSLARNCTKAFDPNYHRKS